MTKKRTWSLSEGHKDASLHAELVLASSDQEKKMFGIGDKTMNMSSRINANGELETSDGGRSEDVNNSDWDWDSENLDQYLEVILDTDTDEVKEKKEKINNKFSTKIQKAYRESQQQLRALEMKRSELQQDFDAYRKKYEKKMADFNKKFESEETTQKLRLEKIEETWDQQIKEYISQHETQVQTEGSLSDDA